MTWLLNHYWRNVFFYVVADYCVKHQCAEHAMCVNGDMKYTCACNSSGWTGSLCKTGDMSTFFYVAPFSVSSLICKKG